MVESMLDFRRELDFVDRDLLVLLERRMEISKRIGKYKKSKGLLIENLNAEKRIIEEKIAKTSLSKDFVRKIYSLISEESRRIQREV